MLYASSETSVHIPRIHRTYTRRDGLYIAMDFVHGKCLDRLWPQLGDAEKRKLVMQVVDIVQTFMPARRHRLWVVSRPHRLVADQFVMARSASNIAEPRSASRL